MGARGAARRGRSRAPSHFGEATTEGLGFLAVGWLQIGLAGAVLLRPSRRVWSATIAVSAATVGAWVVSRTTGPPLGAHAGEAESVTIVDGSTVAMEAVAAVLAAALLLGLPRDVRRFRSDRLALGVVVGVVALVSVALAAPEARSHGQAPDGGHGHTGADSATPAATLGGDDHGHGIDEAPLTDLNGHESRA